MKQKLPHAEALKVAAEIAGRIHPVCHQVEIVGSLRRLKPLVGDVELLFRPRYEARPDGLFETQSVDLADEYISSKLVTDGYLAKRMTEATPTTPSRLSSWGLLNKHAVHVETGINVDLFAEPEELDWIRSLIIRTGPKDFNIKFITNAARNGVTVHAYSGDTKRKPGFERTKTGFRIPVQTEAMAFALAKMKYLKPEERI